MKSVSEMFNDDTPITPEPDSEEEETNETYFTPKLGYEQEKIDTDREMERVVKELQEEELSKYEDPLIEFMDDDMPNLFETARNRK